jgi:hypothetical protein
MGLDAQSAGGLSSMQLIQLNPTYCRSMIAAVDVDRR